MKIAILAANGKSGQALTKELLAAGHSVIAGMRGPSRLGSHEKLEVRRCDGTSLEDVEGLMDGCEALVSLVGHVRGSQRDVQTAATMNIVRAAKRNQVSRIVSLTGTGVRFPGDNYGPIDRLMNASIRLIDPTRIQDGIDHAEVLKASGLDWTIVRVLKLTTGPADTFMLTKHGPGKIFVPRLNVAQAVREVLEQFSYVQEAPIISPAQSI